MNRGLPMPTEPIRFELTSPKGEEWVWGESNENIVAGTALEFALLVTQRRNLNSLNLSITGHTAESYSKIAQCFAGPPTDGPPDN